MPSSTASSRRHFLPWDRPLLPQAVAFLAGDWRGDGPLDLSPLLVLTPTRQSGRRLREALAAFAAEKNQAVFPPRVATPDALLDTGKVDAVASRLESLLAWTEVLQVIDLAAFPAVFPVAPPARNFNWAAQLAATLARLQNTLAEIGLRLGDAPEKLPADFPELDRWRQLAELGALHAETLARRGLTDGQAAKIGQALEAAVPDGVERIVMIATADPRPIALGVLARHARALPVEILVFAPESEVDAFDTWGRPLPEVWAARPLALDNLEQRVHLLADPEAQAGRVVESAKNYQRDEGLLALGLVDPEVLARAETGLRQAGVAAFNPEGRSRRGDRLQQLLAALAGLAGDESFSTVETLARCPDFLAYLRHRLGGSFSAAEFLAELDDLRDEHLPPDLPEARRHAPKSMPLLVVEELREALRRGAFPENISGVLAEFFGHRRLDLTDDGDAALAEAAGAWTEVSAEVARAADFFEKVDASDWWMLALRLYGETTRSETKIAGAVELQGWLELIWEDAPHLVVAGLNDGIVPEAIVGDPFLPESLRERLGLKTNAMRFACDAYFLQALAASRARGGRLDVLFGKTSAAGDPLRPSRLLLRCADAELPRRVEFLFRDAGAGEAGPPWRRAWTLQVPDAPAPRRVAVTGLRGWLACPFRFYLGHVLKMAAVDPGKTEMDALDFGTLCHAALEAMGRSAAMRDCTDAEVLGKFLHEALEQAATERYGRELALPLLVQLESARQRLSGVARVQAETRAEGWVIERVEWKFELPVAGLAISGKIDRIDRHAETGAIRVLDYKTSDKAVDPEEAHVGKRGKASTLPEWAALPSGGEVWRDLQLPIYERAAAGEFAGAQIVCGYFNLPKATTETAIAPWPEYSRELAESAWRCAEGVAAAIAAKEFWPPRELSGREAGQDEFAALFHHGEASSLAWSGAKNPATEAVS